jgi:vitamin B12 transporter
MKIMTISAIAGLCFGANLMAPAVAQEVDEIVVSATGIPTPAAQIGASVDVITAEELENLQVTYLQDALSGLKGITFDQEGTTGGIGNLRMRGLGRQNIVVFIDGVNMADAADIQGGAEIANLLVEDIERIEVMRGPNSVLYGSNAVAGVIDIRTKSAGGSQKASLSATTGANELAQVKLGTSGEAANGRVGYRVSLQSVAVSSPSEFDEQDTDYSENEDYKNTTASGQLEVQLSDLTSLSLNLRSAVSSADTDGYDPISDPISYSKLDGHFGTDTVQNLIRLSLDSEVSDVLSLNLNHSFLGNYRDGFAEVGSTYWYDGERETSQVRAEYTLSDASYLHLGAEQKNESLLQAGFDREVEAETQAAFSVWHMKLGMAHTTLGWRHDDHETFGSNSSWRFGLSLPFNDSFITRLNAGTGYRAPSLYELFGKDATCINGMCGNLELEPEKSDSVELGFAVEPSGKSWVLDVGYFDIETENRIFYQNVGPNTYEGNYQNDDGQSTSTGTEASLGVDVTDTVSVDISYSRINSRTASGSIQNNQPRRLWSFNGYYKSNDGKTNLSVTARQVTDRYRSSIRQEDYFVMGFAYGYQLTPTVKLNLAGDNIWDEHYQTVPGKSTPRRTWNLGLTASF